MNINMETIMDYISGMTTEEKVGQLCVPILQSGDIPPEIERAISELGVGMLRYCPNANFDNASVPIGEPNRYLKPSETAELTNSLQKMAKKTRLQIPLLIAVDQEGSTRSDMNRAGVTVYPAHMAFGAIDDVELTYSAGKVTALEFRAMGINLVQAPILDVITYEGRKTIKASSFGESVDLVAMHGVTLLKGYKAGQLSAMAKHFPGYGSIGTDAHKGVAEITKSLEELESEDFVPFKSVFAENVDGIMMGHVITRCLDDEDVPATLSRKIITDTIRNKMGFDGIIETDAMRMRAIQERYGTAQASVMAVKAGCDLVLLRGEVDHFLEGYEAILKAVKEGEIDETELNEAVRRILTVKHNLGLFDNPFADPEKADRIVGCSEHRRISRTVAERSVTLLRNKTSFIPVPNNSKDRFLVVSVEPQKIAAAMDPVQSVDMLIQAVRNIHENTTGYMAKLNPTEKDISEVVKLAEDSDAIVIGTCNVVLYPNQVSLLKALQNSGKSIIVVAMESPYDIEELSGIENYLCTYGVSNDSMEAAAEVIFGTLKPTGKLPVKVKY
jgi:beta-N-acetylhexosaminidase